MTNNYKILFILLIASIYFTNCKKENGISNYDYGYNYLPDDSGHYIIYKVDSTIYNDFDNSRRYSTIYLKEKIGEQFLDNMNRISKRIWRYYCDSIPVNPNNWETHSSDYIVKSSLTAERVVDNLRYIIMVFPNDLNEKWLGNKYITIPPPYILDSTNYFLSDWKYTIKERDKYYNNGSMIFDSTLFISHIQDSSAIFKTFSTEKYARNVGLVYKELWIVTGQINIGAAWQDRAQKGFILKQNAIAYGKE